MSEASDRTVNRNIDLDKSYDPVPIEGKWYEWWMQEGLFDSDVDKTKEPFTIVIPPPNVTGTLHMGHAYNHTFQDILCRYKRARGFNVLWLPGMDHAGIATQNVVERQLAAQGLTRNDLGREEFVEKVWEWKAKSGGAILGQMKKLGDSCDWRRERFTMDEGLSKAVRTVFVRLFEKGLIYKGKYIINWCPRCMTALSDLEVEHKESMGHMYHVRYPFADGSGYILVATSRPETIIADVAVAVHPRDEKNAHAIGKDVIVPMTGGRTVKVIEDNMVDPEYGTGFVKITPAHDPNDFLVGQRHNLPQIQVIDEKGFMNELAGAMEGMPVSKAREYSKRILEEEGLLERIEELPHQVGHCYRCDTVVEPYLSEQWFVKVPPLAERGVKASEEGEISWIPPHWAKTYYQWMDGVRDWCISRQLWWGHRIPAWTCGDCGQLIVAEEAPVACPRCGGTRLVQDEDVLDTWFSSALWPFSTLGWPEETEDLKYYYPTTVLVTAFDIIFFWVSRMIMMGLEFRDEVPFHDVYIHALVKDKDGQKMSKSKGNVIDPLDMIDKFGADALRFTVAALTMQGRDILLDEKKIETYKHFLNKIWNASRFALMNLGEDGDYSKLPDYGELRIQDRWILEELREVTLRVTEAVDRYDIGDAARALYDFVWGDVCDWYIEMSKSSLYGDFGQERQDAVKAVLNRVFHDVLQMLHPFVPFMTEELWRAFDFGTKPMELESWPTASDLVKNEEVMGQMAVLQEFIYNLRVLRVEANVAPGKRIATCYVITEDESVRDIIKSNLDLVSMMAKVDAVEFLGRDDERPHKALIAVPAFGQIFVPVGDLLDVDAEIARLLHEKKQIESNLAKSESKLSSPSFVERAPQDVVEKERARMAESRTRIARIDENIASLSGD